MDFLETILYALYWFFALVLQYSPILILMLIIWGKTAKKHKEEIRLLQEQVKIQSEQNKLIKEQLNKELTKKE